MPEITVLPSIDPSMSYDQLFVELLKNLPDELCVTLRVGALPHFLDEGLAGVLFKGDPAANLGRVASFPFVTQTAPGRFEYHASTRQILLNNWQVDDPKEFRRLNGVLRDEFMRRLEATAGGAMALAVEWAYHAVAANPDAGMRSMTNLFHELLETRELGAADRLARLVAEQKPWLGDQAAWLEYFPKALAIQRFQPVDMAALGELARRPLALLKRAPADTGIFLSGRSIIDKALKEGVPAEFVLQNSLLAGCVRRLQGRLALINQQWADGRRYLREALQIFEHLGNLEEQALTHLELGNRFYAQVIGSGGVQADHPTLKGWLANFLFILSRLPLLVYRWCAERFEPLPDLYDGSYQNWMSLRLLRESRSHYQAAAKIFKRLGNQRGQLETDFYLGRILLVLGYFDHAAQRCVKALQHPLAVSSPYYSARLYLVIAQAKARQRRVEEARKLLDDCLETFTRYGDWRLVQEAALALGPVLEKLEDWPALIESTAQGLEAARRSLDALAETRIASRLEWYIEMPGPGPAERQAAQKLRHTITCLAYIDRFPGAVRRSFNKLANWLAFPFVFLFALTFIFASGFLMQFIEGELRIQPDPVHWLQGLELVVRLALPVLMLWGYYVFYQVIGQIVAVYLSLNQVDETQPETWSIEQDGISKMGEAGPGGKERRLAWDEVQKLVIDNRAFYCLPMMFSSRMHLVPADRAKSGEPLELTASIFRYSAMQSELEKRLAGKVVKSELSLLRTHWLWIALLVGFAIAVAAGLGVFGAPLHGCYNDPLVTTPQDFCRPEYRVYVQPVVQVGLFITSLFFGAATWLRWLGTNRKMKREVNPP